MKYCWVRNEQIDNDLDLSFRKEQEEFNKDYGKPVKPWWKNTIIGVLAHPAVMNKK